MVEFGGRAARPGGVVIAALVALLAVACSATPFTLQASAPWTYSAKVDPPFERVAILVTITNRSGDDLAVNPADFVARDADHQIYPANPTATASDAEEVRLASGNERGTQNVSPLPTVTLRQDDVLTGFVVFDVPTTARLTELIWRQSDTDTVIALPTPK